MSPAPAAQTSDASRLEFADGLRGCAALWVVLFHASEGGHLVALKSALPGWFSLAVFDAGHLGVPVFFVLSGFVMALTVHNQWVTGTYATRFVLRRLVRLTPPYYLSVAVVLMLSMVKSRTLGEAWQAPSLANLFAHATYLQGVLDMPPFNPVYWTLCIEVQFYLAFAALIWVSAQGGRNAPSAEAHLTKAHLTKGQLALGIGSMVVALAWPTRLVTDPLWSGGFMPFWFSFMAGVLACWSWREAGLSRVALRVSVAILLVAGVAYQDTVPLTAAGTAGLLAAAGALGKMRSWLRHPALQRLGLISYSLYLLHNPITGASFSVTRRIFPANVAGELAGLVVTLMVCVVLSALAYATVERISIGWSRKLSLRRPLNTHAIGA